MVQKTKKLEFDLSEITIDDLVEFEEGNTDSVKFIRDFMGRYVSDGNGNVIDSVDGIKRIGKLRLTEINMLSAQFTKEIKRITTDAVNPTNEDSSET